MLIEKAVNESVTVLRADPNLLRGECGLGRVISLGTNLLFRGTEGGNPVRKLGYQHCREPRISGRVLTLSFWGYGRILPRGCSGWICFTFGETV